VKNLLRVTLAILCTAVLGSYCSSVLAQVTSNTTNTNTNLTATMPLKFGFDVNVLFESPNTLILSGKSEDNNNLWQAVDFAKQFGYKIDAVSQVTESEVIYKTRYLSPVYTIFLSK